MKASIVIFASLVGTGLATPRASAELQGRRHGSDSGSDSLCFARVDNRSVDCCVKPGFRPAGAAACCPGLHAEDVAWYQSFFGAGSKCELDGTETYDQFVAFRNTRVREWQKFAKAGGETAAYKKFKGGESPFALFAKSH